ncbi:MAG: hypothetical protein Q8P50_15940 [Bacillota bacterium]|nr:hypothetical protein [Bacillota bacterium]
MRLGWITSPLKQARSRDTRYRVNDPAFGLPFFATYIVGWAVLSDSSLSEKISSNSFSPCLRPAEAPLELLHHERPRIAGSDDQHPLPPRTQARW